MLGDAGFADCILQEHEDEVSAEMPTQTAYEDIFFFAVLYGEMRADIEDVGLQELESAAVDGHPSFFIAFAEDVEAFLFRVYVGEFEVDQLADTEAAPIKHLDDDEVALAVRCRAVEGALNGVDIGVGEYVGQMLGTFGKGEEFCGVVDNGVVENHHLEESPEGRDEAALGGGGDVEVVELCKKLLEMVSGDVARTQIVLYGITFEVRDIAEIGGGGVGREGPFETQVCLELTLGLSPKAYLSLFFCLRYHFTKSMMFS